MHSFTYEDLRDSTEWTMIHETEGSDYSGSSVTRSNFEYFRVCVSDTSDLAIVSGWFGSYGIAYRNGTENTEILEIIDSLTDYPLICDEFLHRVESRWIEEAMHDLVSDFMRAVEKETGNEEIWNEVERIDVSLIFDECIVQARTEWIFEHSSAWVDVDLLALQFERVIASTDLHLVFSKGA